MCYLSIKNTVKSFFVSKEEHYQLLKCNSNNKFLKQNVQWLLL